MQIAQVFHTVFIRDVPQLTLSKKSEARRFITLIDNLYDNRIRVVMSADVPLDNLFNFSDKPTGFDDSQRILMDDLKISVIDLIASMSRFSIDVFLSYCFFSLLLELMSSPAKRNYLPLIVQFPAFTKCRKKNTGINGVERIDAGRGVHCKDLIHIRTKIAICDKCCCRLIYYRTILFDYRVPNTGCDK